MGDNFNISKDGLQIPYRRFLSDSAAGFVFLLLLVVHYYVPLVAQKSLRELIRFPAQGPAPIGSEVKVFVVVLLFLLATPLGFAINGISWFCLGQVITAVEEICFWLSKHGNLTIFPVWDISDSRLTRFLVDSFYIHDKAFTQATSLIRQALKSPPLAEFAPETQVRGLVEFLRNAALLMLAGAGIGLCSSLEAKNEWLLWVNVSIAVIVLVVRIPRTKTTLKAFHYTLTVAALVLSIWLCSQAKPISVVGQSIPIKPLPLLVASVIVLLIAGSVGFYECCALLLHAHFARVAVGGGIPDVKSDSDLRDESVRTVTYMVRRASVLARTAPQKPK
jgi:hypothetical protein